MNQNHNVHIRVKRRNITSLLIFQLKITIHRRALTRVCAVSLQFFRLVCSVSKIEYSNCISTCFAHALSSQYSLNSLFRCSGIFPKHLPRHCVSRHLSTTSARCHDHGPRPAADLLRCRQCQCWCQFRCQCRWQCQWQ